MAKKITKEKEKKTYIPFPPPQQPSKVCFQIVTLQSCIYCLCIYFFFLLSNALYAIFRWNYNWRVETTS